MNIIRDFSIARKLTWMNLLVSGSALLLACAGFVGYDVVTFRQSIVRRLSIQAQIVGSNSASALLFNDAHSAESTLAALEAAPNIMSAGIYTADGHPFAAYGRKGGAQIPPPLAPLTGQAEAHWFGNNQIVLIRSIIFQGKVIGIAYIRSDLSEMDDRLKRYAGIVAIVLATSLVAAFFISSIPQRVIAAPIVALAETARIVSRDKNYSVRAVTIGNRDEMSILIEAFNEMLGQIQERDAALQKGRDDLEQRVQQRTAELDAANKELEAFTYSVAHDLRAPLRHIDGFSKMLMEEDGAALSDEAKRYLARIREGTSHMGQLVDDLLNLARLGRQELGLQVTGLSSLVEDVLKDLKAENTDREIQWNIQPLPFVECDPGLVRQVFSNLLSNALKYTRPRKMTLIEVSQRTENGEIIILVRDNGVGFSMKYADKLFGVFQRLHRAEDFEGTGVGLATVQRIVRKHGGRVWAEAELDKGATFYFTLGKQKAEGGNGKAEIRKQQAEGSRVAEIGSVQTGESGRKVA